MDNRTQCKFVFLNDFGIGRKECISFVSLFDLCRTREKVMREKVDNARAFWFSCSSR